MSFLPLLFGTVQTIEGALENFLSFLSAVIKAIIRSYVGCEGWNFLCKITVKLSGTQGRVQEVLGRKVLLLKKVPFFLA